jgi:succinate dehydrogenase flavin-adding protein (antitoxin of CptAB toxin-antitoxin module)
MITTKVTKGAVKESTEERLFKLLESIDWKLWEMMNMMKAQTEDTAKKPAARKLKKDEE